MAKNSVIVRRLHALEALGGVTYVLLVGHVGSVLNFVAEIFAPTRLAL